MICRKKAQRGFGARYPIATLQLVVYVCCCYFATLPCSSGGSQRRGTAISAGTQLCCSACVTLGVAWRPHRISTVYFWKSCTSTHHCNIMADMLMQTSTSTSYPAAHLHFLGLLCHSNLQMACRSLRQQRSAGLIFIENVVQCVNLTFYTMPNVYLNQRPCNITDPFLFWCAWVRWTCWNTVGCLTFSNLLLKHDSFNMQGNVTVTVDKVHGVVGHRIVASQS